MNAKHSINVSSYYYRERYFLGWKKPQCPVQFGDRQLKWSHWGLVHPSLCSSTKWIFFQNVNLPSPWKVPKFSDEEKKWKAHDVSLFLIHFWFGSRGSGIRVGPGHNQHLHLSKRWGKCRPLSPLVPVMCGLQITGNYISQALLLSGFLAGSANGRHWLKTEGREEEAVRIFLTPPTYAVSAAATSTPWLWFAIEVLAPRLWSYKLLFCPFSQGVVATELPKAVKNSCYW